MEQSLRIRLLGGVNEVGGNIVFLEDFKNGVKILLDFGVNIKKFKEIFSQREYPSSIEELINLRLILSEKPHPIDNLYTKQARRYRQDFKDKAIPLI